jgi:inner membrane protein
VDSLTHALVAAACVYALGLPQLLPFVVIGAVIIDADFLFFRISRDTPELYLFTHGGCAHSVAGAAVMAFLAWCGIAGGMLMGIISPGTPLFSPVAVAAILGGAFLHIGLDALATPGIPLLVPFSDKKYSAGVLAGPSLFLFMVSLFVLTWLAMGAITLSVMIVPYAVVVVSYLAVRLVAACIARLVREGGTRAVPSMNPLRWTVIGETPEAWTVRTYEMGKGFSAPVAFRKFRGITAGDVARYRTIPEVKRVLFNSYITIAEKEGDTLVISDPLRSSGTLFYPPHYTEVRVPLRDTNCTP